MTITIPPQTSGYKLTASNTIASNAGTRGTLSGSTYGIYLTGDNDTVINTGSILGAGSNGGTGSSAFVFGPNIVASLTNAAGAVIAASGQPAVFSAGSTASSPSFGIYLQNNGTIHAYGNYAGIVAYSGATIVNGASGSILGGIAASDFAATVTNSGKIVADTVGSYGAIGLKNGGNVTNLAGGVLSGVGYGVSISGGVGTVTNAGTIVAGVTLASGFANRVVADPGAVFTGTIIGNGTLELASGSSTGTLNATTATFSNFSATTLDSGAGWVIAAGANVGSGLGTIAGFTSTDTIQLTGNDVIAHESSGAISTVTLTGSSPTTLTFLGTLALGVSYNSSTHVTNLTENAIGPSLTTGGTATFTSGGTAVPLDATASITDSSNITSATIWINSGFAAGDQLNFLNQNGITGSFNAATGTLVLSGTASAATFQAAIDSVTFSFSPADGDPTQAGNHTSRTIDWQVADASGSTSITSSAVITQESSVLNYGQTIQENGIVAASETVNAGVMTLANSGGTVVGHVTVGNSLNGTGDFLLTNDGTNTTIVVDTVFGTYASGITLLTNPTTIAATGQAIYTSAGGRAVRGPSGTTWTLVNQGLVSEPASGGIGISFASAGTVVNAGQIIGNRTDNSSIAVLLANGGTVSNQAPGTIEASYGIRIAGAAGSVTNLGTIIALDTAGGINGRFGVVLSNGGLVVNGASGGTVSAAYISGYYGGVKFGATGTDTLINDGVVYGRTRPGGVYNGAAVTLNTGTVINGPSGDTGARITAAANTAVRFTGSGTVVNYGTIRDNNAQGGGSTAPFGMRYYGVALTGGGIVNNLGSASLIEGYIGVYGKGGVTVTNAGTIAENTPVSGNYLHPAALDFAGGTNRLILDPGAVFVGEVTASGTSTLELASGAATGTISGLGTKYVGFANIVVDPGAAWLVTGSSLGAGYTLYDFGTLTNAAKLGSTVTLGNGALLTNAAGGTISLSGNAVFGGIGTVVNAGDIVASSNTVTVANIPTVASHTGVYLTDAGSYLNNSGTITASLYAAELTAGGSITNSGVMYGGKWGIESRGPISITNSGTISGSLQGIVLSDGGFVDNSKLISGADGIGIAGAAGTVENSGTITSYGAGAALRAGGVVSNTGTGLISITGNYGAVYISGGAGTVTNGGTLSGYIGVQFVGTSNSTLIDTGTIIGSGGTAVEFGGGNDRLQFIPSASIAIKGTVNGGGGTSTLEFASGATQGTLTGLGADFINFTQGTIDSGASWVFAGSSTLASGVTLTNSGTDKVTGTLVNAGRITGVSRAIILGTGGRITNAIGGTITSNGIGVAASGNGTLVNYGLMGASTVSGVGVSFAGSGTVTNQSGGTITGYDAILGISAPITVTNAGVVLGNTTAASAYGVLSYGGLLLTNLSTGTISGHQGVNVQTLAATVNNAGVISGDTGSGKGIYLAAGGLVTNQSGGVISGESAVFARSGVLTVVNAGSIGGTSVRGAVGVAFEAGGTLTNLSGGVIAGSYGVFGAGSAASIVNAGSILGEYGVALIATGRVTNQSGGLISGSRAGVYADAAATVVNAGSIAGTIDGVVLHDGGTIINQSGGMIGSTGTAVQFGAGYTSRLVIDPGARFSGTVNGGNTIGATSISTLELASGASAGTLNGFGSTYVNFGQIAIDAGAQWDVVGSDATNALGGATITGFSYGDTIDVTNFNATSETFDGRHLTLTSGASAITLDVPGGYITQNFRITNDGSSGTDITLGVATLHYGDTIDEAGILATSDTVNAGGTLTLFNSGNTAVGSFKVGTTLNSSDFQVTNNGTDSSVVVSTVFGTYTSGITLDVLSTTIAGTASVSTTLAAGVAVNAPGGTVWTLTNYGQVSSTGAGPSYGVELSTNSILTNAASGTISGAYAGVGAAAGATVNNAGTILQTGAAGEALRFSSSGRVNNSGLISGVGDGITGNGVVIANAGTILAGDQAIHIQGVVLNGSSGSTGALISGSSVAIYVGGASSTIVNYGTITGTLGITASTSGGIHANTVIDAGTIIGSGGTAVLLQSAANLVELIPGFAIQGTVNGGSGGAELELASAGTAGTISALSTQFVGFSQIVVDSGAQWTLSGGNSIASGVTLTDSGTATVTGTLVNDGVVTGTNLGLALAAGALISNQSGGTISAAASMGSAIGVIGYATVVNAGVVQGGTALALGLMEAGSGVSLTAGGSVTNLSGGTISGARAINNVSVSNPAFTVVNAGSIAGGTSSSNYAGVYSESRGLTTVTNQAGGVITGVYAINVLTGDATVVNAGSLAGSDGGVLLNNASSITNQSGGVISGFLNGVNMLGGAPVTVVNAGLITAHTNGVVLQGGGTVINTGTIHANIYVVDLRSAGQVINLSTGILSSGAAAVHATQNVTVTNAGQITATQRGVVFSNGGTLINQSGGTIHGNIFDAVLFQNVAGRVIIDPGAVFIGTVDGGAALSTLELASGASAGTLNGFGSTYVNFGNIVFDAGAQWDVVGSDATTALAGATLTGFAYGDTIDVTNFQATSEIFSGNHLTLTSGASSVTLDVPGSFITQNFTITNDGGTGTDITLGAAVLHYGDTIDEVGIVATSETVNAGTLTLFNSGNTAVGTIGVGTTLNTSDFLVTNNGTNTQAIVDTVFGTYTSGITLDVVNTTIAATASVSGTVASGAAVYGPAGTSWTLTNDGQVSDTASGGNGVSFASSGTVINAGGGTITGAASGILLAGGGAVTNQSGGAITGKYGVRSGAIGVTVVNAGSILGAASYPGDGIYLAWGGTVTNLSGGVIAGNRGMIAFHLPATIDNAGIIAGNAAQPLGEGLNLQNGGSITNAASGTISGATGLGSYGQETVVNAGTIVSTLASGNGVALAASGLLTNQSGGVISGGANGVYVRYSLVTVVNAGTIGGATDAVKFKAGYTDRLAIDPGAKFVGTVDGGNTIGGVSISTLELASAATAGTLSGLGTQDIDFARITIDSGAQWTLAGYNTLAHGATLTNSGTATVSGTLVNDGVVTAATQGLVLGAGALISNQSGGIISATATTGIAIGSSAAGTVMNAGVVSGDTAAGQGISLAAGGLVTNQSGGVISGDRAIYAQSGAMTVVNAGSIAGGTAAGSAAGVMFEAGGALTNLSGGVIAGYFAVAEYNSAVSIVNAGSLLGKFAVLLDAADSVTNQSGGLISGSSMGLLGNTAVTVVNAGSIAGAGDGVVLHDGGTIINQSGGMIGSTGTAVQFGAGYTSRLVIDPGARFSGTVNGGNTIGATSISTLELASGASAGTLNGFGSTYVNFGQIAIDAGAQWDVVGSDATNALAGATITGFTYGDTIDVTNFAATGSRFVGGELTLTSGASSVTLDVPGNFITQNFRVTNDGTGGTDITLGVAVLHYGDTIDEAGIVATSETVNAGTLTLFNSGNTAVGTIGVGTTLNTSDFLVTNNGTNTQAIVDTVFGTYTSGITLDVVNTTIAATASVGNTVTGGVAVNGPAGTNWTLTNYGLVQETAAGGIGISFGSAGSIVNAAGGTVIAASRGIALSAGGVVSNVSGGSIGGGIYGISASAAATIGNAGVITGGNANGNDHQAGVYERGGLLTNQAGGTITGYFGFWDKAAAATVINAGSIGGNQTEANAGGVYMRAGGSVTNQSGGVITGIVAVGVVGTAIAMVNAGLLSGNPTNSSAGFGFYSSAGGSVTNLSGGTIIGFTGVYAKTDALTVTNAGSIGDAATSAAAGIALAAGGSVTNASGGLIGGHVGIAAGSGTMTVVNAGSILGNATIQSGYGIKMLDDGVVTNQAGGTIGGYQGIAAGTTLTAVTLAVTNAGVIAGSQGNTAADGIFIWGSGTVDNLTGGTITGYGAVLGGSTLSTTTLAVTNAGVIAGHSAGTLAAGVQLVGNGTVTNLSGGTIAGYEGVLAASTLAATTVGIDNAGLISADQGGSLSAGILMLGSGTVTNKSTGTIIGAQGIDAAATLAGTAVTIGNAGMIAGSATGASAAGIFIWGNGTVDNLTGGTITGYSAVRGGSTLSTTTIAVTNAGIIAGYSVGTLAAGVQLAGDGTVTNLSSGRITGYEGVFAASTLASTTVGIDNAGLISAYQGGVLSAGVLMLGSGTVTNESTGTIIGAQGIVAAATLAATSVSIGNAGTIAGSPTGASAAGILFASNGTIANASGGVILGYQGILAGNSLVATTIAIDNAGSIASNFVGTYAPPAVGIAFLNADASVTNRASGTITGYSGIELLGTAAGGTGSIQNAGVIGGHSYGAIGGGILTEESGTISNLSGGTIYGASGVVVSSASSGATVDVVNAGLIAATGTNASAAGVEMLAAGTVANLSGGTIIGAIDAVIFTAGFTNRLIDNAGATFVGRVDGGNTIGATAISTLELASGASAGTLSGLGSTYIDFGQVTIDAGAAWIFSGVNSVASGATLTNSGTLVGTGTLLNAGSIGGNGISLIDAALTNLSGGVISSFALYGLASGGADTVLNQGSIGGYSIYFQGAGNVTNASGAQIVNVYGVKLKGDQATLVNQGQLTATATIGSAYAAYLRNGGLVINGQANGSSTSTASMQGYYGVIFTSVDTLNQLGTLQNYGTIVGTATASKAGVIFSQGGNVINGGSGATGALIQGGRNGVYNAIGTVTNYGTITATDPVSGGYGVQMSGGAVSNLGHALIEGNGGVGIGVSGTVLNDGTIESSQGSTGIAVKFGGGNARLIEAPTASLIGGVNGGIGGTAVLELASGASAGTIVGLGTSIVNFTSLVFDAGAQWTVEGNDSANGLGTLAIGGFTFGDTIDLSGFVAVSDTFGSNALVLTNAAAAHETLHVAGTFSTANVHIAGDGSGGTDIFLEPAPTITAGATASFAGGSSPVVLDNSIAITDPNGPLLNGATIEINSGFVSGDVLNYTSLSGLGITGSYDAATGTLTLSGAASIQNYESALDSVTYGVNPANADPTAGGADLSRTIGWIVNDTTGSSTVSFSTLDVTHVAPTLTAGGTVDFLIGGTPVALDAGIAVSDPDSSGLLSTATVDIVGGLASGDLLNFVNTGGITGSYNASTGALVLSGTASIATYDSALASITYSFFGSDPSNGATDPTRTITWQVSDGSSSNGISNVGSTGLNVYGPPPVIGQTAGTIATFIQQGSAVVADNAVTVADGDSTTLAGATVVISNGFLAGDTLTATTGGTAITALYSNGTLTLSGVDTLANYQQVLDSVTYDSSATDPTNGGTDFNRTLTWQVNDGRGGNNLSNIGTTTVSTHVRPVVDASGTQLFAIGRGPVLADAGITVADNDTNPILLGTVAIASGLLAGDVLAFNSGTDNQIFGDGATIAASFDSGTGVLSFSTSGSVASAADWQQALASVTFDNPGTNPSNNFTDPTRTLNWMLDTGDPAQASVVTVSTVEVAPPPIIAGTAAGQTTTDEAAIDPFSGVTITDLNAGQTETVTITLSNNANGALSNLGLGSYDSKAGDYVFTGSASAVTSAIDGLVFNPTAHQVVPGDTVTTTFTIDTVDTVGAETINSNTTVIATAVNDPPTLTQSAVAKGVPNQAANTPFAVLTVTDPDVGHTDTVTITMSSAAGGVFSDLSGGIYDASAGTYTFTGTPTQVNAALAALAFNPNPPAAGNYVATTYFTVEVTGEAAPPAINSAISVTTVPQSLDQANTGSAPPNVQVSPDGTGFPAATPGDDNEAIISAPANGGAYSLPGGYQAAYLGGSADASLSDNSVGNALLVGNTGDDTISAAANGDTLTGGAGNNTFVAGGTRDVIGLTGNSIAYMSGTDDTTYAGPGTVTVTDSGTNDAIGLYTGPADLTLSGTGTRVYGNSGALTLDETSSASGVALGLGGGPATLTVGGSSTTVYGGAGNLTADVSGSNATFGLDRGSATLTVSGSNAAIYGGSGSLTADITGNNAKIGLGTGTSAITLSGSDAQVYGGSGSFSVDDQGNADTISAGIGSTRVTAGGSNAVVVGGGGDLQLIGGANAATVFAGTGSTSITGGSGPMTLYGGAGGVVNVNGGPGPIAYQAGSGNETLNAAGHSGNMAIDGGIDASGHDLLIGGSGNDTLYAGTGADTLVGGGGSNEFVFVRNLIAGTAPHDVIADFNSNDVVLLEGYGANAAQNALFSAISSAGSTTMTLADNTQITFLNMANVDSLFGRVVSS